MTAFLIFIGVWSLVALAISLLLGSHLGRRRRPAIDPLGVATPRPPEGDAHPGDEIRGGQPASHPRQGVPRRDVPNRWRMVLELVAIEPCRYEKKGLACRLLNGSARDLWWCPPCLAYDALDSLTTSTPVSSPGVEAAPSAASRDDGTATEGASNFP
jgi:hypothetical protein